MKSRLRSGEKVLICVTLCVVLLGIYLISPFSKSVVALAVMSVYSAQCAKDGIPQTAGIKIDIPVGTVFSGDWFPLMMTFVPGRAFGNSVGRNCELTILYDFPAFDAQKGCSRLFDESSGYYSSFYGAYLVRTGDDSVYGFYTDEAGTPLSIRDEEIAAVAQYDYQRLVLSDFGLSAQNAVFAFDVTNRENDVSYAGSSGWFRVDAELTVNGCAHEKNAFTASYLQYGIPGFSTQKPLAPVTMYGRLYGNYFPDKKVTIFFYVIAHDASVLQTCDDKYLSGSTLVT